MKLQVIAFAALIALSGAASAEFFNGFDNGTAAGNTTNNGTGSTAANGTGYSNGNGDVNGFGRGKGDADGEVDFSLFGEAVEILEAQRNQHKDLTKKQNKQYFVHSAILS